MVLMKHVNFILASAGGWTGSYQWINK